jgi:ketosteroid isomerase-like protein
LETASLRSPLVRQAIEAINQGQLDDFMALFAQDATVVDVSTYTGLQQIRDWAQRETFGVQVRFQLESEKNKEGTIIAGQVQSAGGYNGPGTFAFTLHDGAIQRLVIS